MAAKVRSPRRPNGSRPDPARSIRVSDELWEKSRRRADYEGVTLSHVVVQILTGYASGMLDLPRVNRVFSQPRVELPGEDDQSAAG